MLGQGSIGKVLGKGGMVLVGAMVVGLGKVMVVGGSNKMQM